MASCIEIRLKGAPGCLRLKQATRKVFDDVFNGDGLTSRVNPPRANHEGRRSTRWRSISNGAPPAPMMLAARRTVVWTSPD